MAEHTPGPWEVLENLDGDGVEVRMATSLKSGSYEPQHVVRFDTGLDDEDGDQYQEMMANAYLIAAAPDLLVACENALHILTPARPEMDGLDRTRMWLREAIARAKGQS